MIDSSILMHYGALQKIIEKDEFIFHEGDYAKYYFQVIRGKIKLFSTSEDGKSFTQGMFSDGDSFGEPPMLIRERYPSSAQSMNRSIIYKLHESGFQQMLEEHREIEHNLLLLMASRCYVKSVTSRELINQKTEHRIMAFLIDYKRKKGNPSSRIHIPFTRQEIADFVGLRVETVIRTLKTMSYLKLVLIEDRKLYF